MFKMKSFLFLFIIIFHAGYCQDAIGDDAETTTIEITTIEITTAESNSPETSTAVTTDAETTTAEMSTADISTTDTSTAETSTADITTADTSTSETSTSETADAETTTVETSTADITTADSSTAKTITEETSTAETTAAATTTESTTVKTTTEEPTTIIPILFLSANNRFASWSPRTTESIIVEAPEGFKISVNVTVCDMDGGNGDYATITTDEFTNGLMFTYGVSRSPAYLYNNNRLFGEFVGTDASNLTIEFTLLGEESTTTTTDIPTTTILLPTPGYSDLSTLLVYLAGKSTNDYLDPYNPEPLNLLINAIAQMAAEYCVNENFPLNESITTNNVIINHLLPCALGWPEFGTCVRLNFSVPVILKEDSDSLWGGYQMTTAHMRIMWQRYARAYLPSGTKIYYPPGDESLKWGIAILIVISLLFALILLCIRQCGMSVSKKLRRRKLSDTASIIAESDRGSDRNSQISLPPHYLQDTPALFENDYPMYNPNKNAEYSEPAYPTSFPYSQYQDLEQQIDDDDDEVEESGA